MLLGGAADLVVVGIGPPGRESIHLVDLRGDGVAARTELEVLDLTRRQARLDLDGAPAHLIAARDEADALRTELAILRRVALAAEHVGMIEAMLDLTRTHLAQRHQFGRPLASFQVIKHRLADVLVDLERARSAARYAAAVFDQDPFSAELPSAVAAARLHRRGHPGGPRDRPAARRHRLHLGAPRALLPAPSPGRRGRLRSGPGRPRARRRAAGHLMSDVSDLAVAVDRPEVAEVRPGEELDWAALERHLRQQLPHLEGDFSVRQFPNGSANLTYLVRFGEDALVVRRPPFGVIAAGAHDMLREYTVLSRLHAAYPRAPLGAALLRRPGGHRRPLPRLGVPPGCRGLGPRAGGAGGRPGARGGASASPWSTRWPTCTSSTRRAATSATSAVPTATWTGRSAAGSGAGRRSRPRAAAPSTGSAELLARHLPESGQPALVHNDFKVDNCQFAPGDPDRVTSVFDWDMATLGDPLTDLGTLLNYWPDGATPAEGVPGVENVGLPSRDEVVERYAARTRQRLTRADVAWYEAFGCWKTAIIMQQLYVRHLRGESSDERMNARGRQAVRIADRALALAETSPLIERP